MTVCAIFFGLLPIMWSQTMQAGADVMKRIAAPMIGGVVTSAILELLIYPVIYVIWRRRELSDKTEEERAPIVPPALVPSRRVRHHLPRIIATIVIVAALIYGANFAWNNFASRNTSGKSFTTQTVNDLTVTLSSAAGQLNSGDNDVLIEFRDSRGNLVDVGSVKFEANMNMPSMQMNEAATIQSAGTPGQYRAKIKLGMPGDWQAKISYDGLHGRGQQSFSVTAK